MTPSVLLLLLSLLSSAGSLPPSRVSFLLNSADRPLVLFSHPDVHNTTTLLLSDDESTLFVGARNALLSLDVSQSDVINLKKKVDWAPSQAEMSDCRLKGKNPAVDCPNFVHVLQPMNSSHLYACGSFAYNPHDAFIDTGSFSVVQQGGAKGRCPFSPFQRTTAITIDGELFTATTTNFRGDKAQISRHFSRGGRPDVSQDSSVSLLEEPTFVTTASDPTDRKLYFFFTEVGKEFSFVDELRIARVAQVCKDDVGGQRTLQRKWTSFAKASLLCQSPKQLPFNVLQDVFTLQPPEGSTTSDTQFFGVFTSQWSADPESAVCVFRLQDVRQVFTESYRTFDMQTHQWSHTLGKHEYLGTCGLQNASDSHLAEVKRSFLTSNSVKPVGVDPVVVSREQRYSRVAAMTTETADGRRHTVLFLLTESGFLHKVVLSDQGARVIEEVQVFTQPQQFMSIVLSSTKGVLYVGTSEGVTAIPVANCSTYRSCSQCILARDPLCGWSRTSRSCISLDTTQEKVAQDLENGNVEEECDGQTNVSLDIVRVHLNEAVRLQCLRPSNLASLTWTSPQSNHLPEKLFIQSADATLSFLASASTFGMYRCVADEGGHKEVIRSYDVRQVAPPRSMTPRSHNHHATDIKDETFEDISTKEPGTSIMQVSGEPEGFSVKGKGDEPTTFLQPETDSRSEDDFKDDGVDLATTSREDVQLRKKWPDDAQRPSRDKSYYSELVVVSLLLATCTFVLILAGLRTWRQKTTGLKVGPLVPVDRGSKTNQSLESIPSLSGSEDPELKVEQ